VISTDWMIGQIKPPREISYESNHRQAALRHNHFSFAYSALTCFRMGMSMLSLRQSHSAQQVGEAGVGANGIQSRIDFDEVQAEM
jgi:hypothetical protein